MSTLGPAQKFSEIWEKHRRRKVYHKKFSIEKSLSQSAFSVYMQKENIASPSLIAGLLICFKYLLN